MINPQIFREYDIRGIVDKDLTDKAVENIGLSFGTYLRNLNLKSVALGGDCRLSTNRFRAILSDALAQTGCKVIDVGTVPTPVLYYAIEKLQTDGGLMVTGSHNPPDFNGFKLCVGTFSIYGQEIQKIREIIDDGVYISGEGSCEKYNSIIQDYQDYVVEHLLVDRPIKVIVDSGNGTAGPIAPDIYRRLGCEVISLFEEMDGTFPNHHPDPTVKENIEILIRKVIDEKADVGIGFDGDSDRIGAVDENGNIVWGDQLLMIFARAVLKEHPGATVISEVKSSKNLYDDVRNHGGNPIMWKTGHSLIKEKMREENALLGGEMSGHMFFADKYFGFDDAIYAGGRLLEILSQTDKPLSELLSDVPPVYNTPEIRIDCPDEKKFEVVEHVKRYFEKKKCDINDIDGMRITFEHGWALVRASNTQPVLVLRFESTSEELLAEIKDMIMRKVEEFIKAAS